MSDHVFVRLEHDGAVSTLTIDRPDKLNALSDEVLGGLGTAIAELEGRTETRCVVMTGEGKAFVAGADISAMKDMGVDEAKAFSAAGHAIFAALEALPFPVIAAVNGFALGGGCELALACDFIYASSKARFGQPEVKLGVIPGFGGTQRLARRVGVAKARELVYTGAMIRADEALRIGLANAVFEPDELLAKAKETAATIATTGPLAVAAAKKVIADGEGLPLAEANALEVEAFAGCFSSVDQTEGMAAFLDKREATFKGE